LPGVFSFPCASDANCTPGLTCRELVPGRKLCTTLCQNDADCAANRFSAGLSFCGGAVCLPFGSLPEGSPCAKNEQCSNKLECKPSAAMSGGPPTCGGK